MRLFAFFVSLLLLYSCSPRPDFTEQIENKTILLKTLGAVSVEPDEASVNINLRCVDVDIKKSKACLLSKSAELQSKILEYAIAEKDILTEAISQSKDYRWQNGSNVFQGYVSSMTTRVTIRDLKQLEGLYTDLLLNENISLGGLSYSHSQMDSLSDIAYQNAVDRANEIADKLLEKMPETQKEISRIGNIELPAESINSEMKILKEGYGGNKSKDDIKINTGTVFLQKELIVEFKVWE